MADDSDEGAGGAGTAESGPGGQVDAEAFMRLSVALRDAFAQVTAARLQPEEGARWQRRLIAITTVAKRDLSRALEQMERFEAEWRARRR